MIICFLSRRVTFYLIVGGKPLPPLLLEIYDPVYHPVFIVVKMYPEVVTSIKRCKKYFMI